MYGLNGFAVVKSQPRDFRDRFSADFFGNNDVLGQSLLVKAGDFHAAVGGFENKVLVIYCAFVRASGKRDKKCSRQHNGGNKQGKTFHNSLSLKNISIYYITNLSLC